MSSHRLSSQAKAPARSSRNMSRHPRLSVHALHLDGDRGDVAFVANLGTRVRPVQGLNTMASLAQSMGLLHVASSVAVTVLVGGGVARVRGAEGARHGVDFHESRRHCRERASRCRGPTLEIGRTIQMVIRRTLKTGMHPSPRRMARTT